MQTSTPTLIDLNELYTQAFSSLSQLKPKYDETNQKLITDALDQLKISQSSYNQTKISLVVVGSTCSGKTTLINAILNALRTSKDSKEKWLEYLPSNATENTCTYTFVSATTESIDIAKSHILVQVNDDPPIIKKNVEELKLYLQQFETNNKLFYEIKKSQKTTGITLPKIHIFLPELNDKIQIIDTPGISTQGFLQELTKIVQDGVCIFLYVKNLDNAETNNTNVLDFFRVAKRYYGQGNYQFWLVFTKEDLFMKKYEKGSFDDEDDIYKKIHEKRQNFWRFLENTEEEIKENDIKINKIFIISTIYGFKPNHPLCISTQGRIRKLIEDIVRFKEDNGDFFMKFIYMERMRSLLETLNDNLHKNTQLNLEVIENIKEEAELIADYFSNRVRKLLESEEFQNISVFMQNYQEKYKNCEDLIEKAKKKVKKETFYIKEKYERRLLELVSQDIHNIVIRDELKGIFFQCYLTFEKFLLSLIDKRLLDFFLGLDSDVLMQQETNLAEIIKENIYNPMVDLTLDMKDLNFLDLTNNLFNPGYREVFFAYLTVKLLNIDNYVDFFPHTVSKESIMEFILKNINENSEKIIETSRVQFEMFLKECIIKKLENAKEMNQEITDIIRKINQIRTIEIKQKSFIIYMNSIYEKIEKSMEFKDKELTGFFEEYMKRLRVKKVSS